MTYIKIPLLRGYDAIKPLMSVINNYTIDGKPNSVVCGGYARWCASQASILIPADDVDVFPISNTGYDIILNELKLIGFTIKHENHISASLANPVQDEESDIKLNPLWLYHPKIQLIKPVVEGKIVTTGSIEQILDNFDFSITRIAILDSENAIASDDFIEDERNRILRIKNIHCPISSLLRCCKYSRKGFFLKPSEALKLFKDWDSRGEEYKKRMIELFEEKSPSGEMTKEEIDELESLLRID